MGLVSKGSIYKYLYINVRSEQKEIGLEKKVNGFVSLLLYDVTRLNWMVGSGRVVA